MQIWFFCLYTLYLLFGVFTIAWFGFGYPMWLVAIIGGIWGYIVGKDAMKRFSDRQ